MRPYGYSSPFVIPFGQKRHLLIKCKTRKQETAVRFPLNGIFMEKIIFKNKQTILGYNTSLNAFV